MSDSIARGGGSTVDGLGFGQRRTGTGPRQAREGNGHHKHHGRPDIEARLKRIEARLAYVGVSLSYMEASRNYIELRLEDAAEDVAYAGDTGLAFEEVRRLYADHHYSAPSGDCGLLARVDAALGSIRVRLAEIDARLAQARSCLAYTAAEVSLSHIEVDLADIEAGLGGVGASIAHADALLSEVGAGTGASTARTHPAADRRVRTGEKATRRKESVP
jgi:hypothetical protein